MLPVKINYRLIVVILIHLPIVLFAQQILNEMEIIDSSDEEDVKSTIIRNPEVAALIVKSQISNLQFNSNNRIIETQQTSPGIWQIQLVPGTHKITFQAVGFISNQIRLFFNRKEVKGLRISVVAAGETGGLENSGLLVITSEPDSAQIYIDDEPYGITNYVGRFSVGTYQLRVQKQYFEVYQREINISNGIITPINLTLDPSYGSLEISSIPNGAKLILDDQEVGKTPYSNNQILYGQHTLEIDLPNYEPVTRTFLLDDSNKVENIAIQLIRKSAPFSLALRPQQANVVIDGKEITSLPIQNLALPYGYHKLEINRAGYIPYRSTFAVNRTDPIHLEVNLEQKSKFIAGTLSTLLPGTGQIYSGNTTRGAIFAASFIGGVTAIVLFVNLRDEELIKFERRQKLYEINTDLDKMAPLYAKMMSTHGDLENIYTMWRMAAWTTFAIWLYNIFDAIVFFPELEKSGITISSFNRGLGITANFHFSKK